MQIFIQTGYPLDLPSGSLGSYCIYEYHMVCYDSFFLFIFYLLYLEEEFFYAKILGLKSEKDFCNCYCQFYSLVQWALLLVEKHFFFGEVA